MALDNNGLLSLLRDAWGYLVAGAGGILFEKFWQEWRRHRAGRAELERLRFEYVYVPLNTLFQHRHIDSARVIMRPYLLLRLRFSRKKLREGNWRAAWRGLWDRGEGIPSAGMTYGDSFPLEEIQEIVNENARYADRCLVLLVRNADRSRYETQIEDGDLTTEEFALVSHIGEEWSRLSKAIERRGLPPVSSETGGA